MRRNRFPLAAALGATLVFGAAATLAAMSMQAPDEPVTEKHTTIRLKLDGADPDTIVMADLHDLAVGESRSFTTESGKIVVATRGEHGFDLEVDGKTIHILDLDEAGPGGDTMVWHSADGGEEHVFQKRIEIRDGGSGGDGETMVWNSAQGDGPHEIRVIRSAGEGGEPHAFAFSTGDDVVVAPFTADGWIERLERTQSFQQLDEATREIVRRAMREAAEIPPSGKGVFRVEVEEKQ